MIKNSIIRKYSVTLAMIVVLALVLPLKACAKEQMLVEEPDGIITMTTKASEVWLFIVVGSKEDFSVDWGDGKQSSVNDAVYYKESELFVFTREYSGATAHNIVITGNVTQLSCGGNLTALDVSRNPTLTRLNCYGNQLTTLDVSRNPALTDLDCGKNQLTALDVSKNTALERLKCNQNQLTALDVSKNTELWLLEVVGNQLTAATLNDLFRTLPDRSKLGLEYVGDINISTYSGGGNPGNSDCDRSIAEVRGWSFHSIRALR